MAPFWGPGFCVPGHLGQARQSLATDGVLSETQTQKLPAREQIVSNNIVSKTNTSPGLAWWRSG